MNSSETKMVLATLRAAYPGFYKDMSKEDLYAVVNLWQRIFDSDPYEQVSAAVLALISSRVEGYPPTPGAVKEKLEFLRDPEPMSETDAWGCVLKAIKNGLYGYKKEFDKLPPQVQAAVGQPEQLREWAMMDVETVQSVVASNFMRTFRTTEKRRKDMAMLPTEIREMIAPLADRMSLPGKDIKCELP